MRSDTKALGYAFVTVLCWSTVSTAFKLSLAHLDVFQLVFYATLTSAVVLWLPVLWFSQTRLLVREFSAHWKTSLIAALLNPLTYYLVLFAAYDRLPAQVAQPVNYTWAIVLAFLGVVLLKQRLTVYDLIAALICYLGVVIIALQGEFHWDITVDLTGLFLALFSTVIWAYYWIRDIRDPRDPRVAMAINFTTAMPFAALCCALFSDFDVSPAGLSGAVYVGIFEMGFAFLLWSRALALATNTTRVSTLIFLAPFLSLYFIHWVLGETIFPTTYLGLVVIVAGLLIQRIPLWGRG